MKIILCLFLIMGVSVSQNTKFENKREMWYALRYGNLTSIKRLINDVPPNTLISYQTQVALVAQRSLLNRDLDIFGIENTWIPIVEFLLDNGADPCLVNGQGRTPYEHYMQYVYLYPNPQIKNLLDVCNSNNIHHAPQYAHCAKLYGNTKQYTDCAQFPKF